MAFTLTDPRMQAISQAAGNFGTGMGNAINQYVNNQIFANALEQAKGQDPFAMMQTLARSNVDPASRELAMSPQILQRMQGINLANMIQEAASNIQSGKGTIQDLYTAALKGMVQSGDMSGVSALLNSYAQNLRANDNSINFPEEPKQTKTEGPNGVQSPRGNAQKTQEPAPTSQSGFSTKGFMGEDFAKAQAPIIPGIKLTGRRPSPEQQIPYAPVTQLPSAKDMEKLKRQFIRDYGPVVGEQAFNDHIRFLKEQKTQDTENLQLAKEVRREQMELNDKDRAAFDAYWNKTFATRPEMNEDIKLAAQDYLINHTEGTIEKRTLQTQNEFLNKIEAPLQTFEKNIKGAPIFASLNSPEKMQYLSELNGLSDQVLKAVPKYFRPQMYDIMRKKLRNISGVGPVSAEIALFPPSDQIVQLFRNLPKKQSTPATAWFGDEKSLKTDEKNKIKLKKLLPTVLKKAVNGGLSPIVAKNLVIAQGWDDADFDAAYKKAKKMGMKISPEMQTADKDVYRQQKPGAMDYIRGNPLLELTEIYQ